MLSPALFGDNSFKFRIMLKDKGPIPFSIDQPEKFLSSKAIERRMRQNIPIDESDLPISDQYISVIESLGCVTVAKSKWLASVTVHCNDSNLIDSIKKLDFVDDAVFVWKSAKRKVKRNDTKPSVSNNSDNHYGVAYKHIALHRGDSLHRAGYRGEGMEIAVIDAGFENLDENLLLSDVMVKGFKDFVYSGDSSYYSSHGVNVLSCMATNHPTIYVGTAPKAKYWLLRSEDPASEFPVEEDYWVTAAEYADSVGVDLINSSLGYTSFDLPAESFNYEGLDGKTFFISRGASIAASKGMFVVISAGNEGAKQWRHISAPGDPESVFTIGAIRSDSLVASFSSRGPTSDLRIKPDVVALGNNCSVIDPNGAIVPNSGTSLSSPIMCGLVACLWQAFPHFTSNQLADIVRQSANKYTNPDNDYGYGIPDMVLAMDIAGNLTGIEKNFDSDRFKIISDSAGNVLIKKNEDDGIEYAVTIYTIDGRLVLSDSFVTQDKIFKLPLNDKRMYIINIKCRKFAISKKIFV